MICMDCCRGIYPPTKGHCHPERSGTKCSAVKDLMVMASSLINGSRSSGALCDEILRRPEKHRTPLNDSVMASNTINVST